MSDGTITEIGTYEELLSHEGDFARIIEENLMKEEQEDGDSGNEAAEIDPEVQEMGDKVLQRLESLRSGPSSDDSLSLSKSQCLRDKSAFTGILFSGNKTVEEKNFVAPQGQKLIEDEKLETGKVDLKIYLHYVREMGLVTFCLALLLLVTYCGVTVYSKIWMAEWTSDSYLANVSLKDTDEYSDKNTKYLVVYAVLGLLQGSFNYTYVVTFLFHTIRAARKMHCKMLHSVMRAPMSFFDTTPMGRIVNRFSRDVESLDNILPRTSQFFTQSIASVLIAVVTIAYSSPIILSVMVPVFILYIIIQRLYIPASRQTRRIYSTTRSPIFSHFTETLSGVNSIRAYGAQDRFTKEFEKRIDHNFRLYLSSVSLQGWLQIRLDFLGNLIVLAAAMFSIINDDLTPSMAALAVTYSNEMTWSLVNLINIMASVETEIVSVERVIEYMNMPGEAARHNSMSKPSADWPDKGSVILDDVKLRYRPGLDLVLHGVSCEIKGGEKVGIVGRTGAGKSSLTIALFRLVEAAEGKITIDGKIIADLGLRDLRCRITILPQDPVIFSTNIRTNLDPSEEHNDDEIWQALGQAHLKDFVKGVAGQLDYECGENGQNLSVGQRQLLCLARTLLRKTKILVLDEATAAVDVETDALIQNTIRTEFKDCTVLTIAHRLNTIMDSDRVMVLDRGLIKELDSPVTLLANQDSVFYSMAKDANLVY